MPPEVRDLGKPWTPLTGSIPDLSKELEKEFRFGQSVIAIDGKYRLGGNLKGGSSAMWIPADRRSFDAYSAWRVRDGLPKRKDRRAFKRLNALLKSHGIELLNGSWSGEEQWSRNFSEKRGAVYALTLGVLSNLPSSHLDGKAFRALQLGGWGPDGAKASAYENGKVMMYDFAVNSARRTYVGLLLHELGHAHESAFKETNREALRRAFHRISCAGAVLGVEFLMDGEARKMYQLRVFEEFMAETYMIYTSQGGGLRDFIAAQLPDVRASWLEAYRVMRDSFEGVEYR
jgi:hypothetical protein